MKLIIYFFIIIEIYAIRNDYLVNKELFRINKVLSPKNDSYLFSEYYIDEYEENILKGNNDYIIQNNQCYFNKRIFINYINFIRDKHSVTPLQWDNTLSSTARILADKNKHRTNCAIIDSSVINNELGQIAYINSYSNPKTEKEIIRDWYSPIYSFKLNEYTNYYPLAYLLFDTVKSVGCSVSCCPNTNKEIIVCVFSPVLVGLKEKDIPSHIKPNKYINK